MIRPKYHPFYIWFFNHYTKISIKRNFSHIGTSGSFVDQKKPIIVIGNHFSWWDGFFAHYLNLKMLKRRYNVLMLEKELKKRMFLNKIGAFSLEKGKRSMVDSLRFMEKLLKDPLNLVVFYPQGKFQSVYDEKIKFEKGISTILSRLPANSFQVFMYAAMIDYFQEKKPTLDFYIDEFFVEQGFSIATLESAYNKLYGEARKNQIQKQ